MPREARVFDDLYKKLNKAELAEMILQGLSIPKIAAHYHVSHSTLGRVFLKKYKMTYRRFRDQVLKEDEIALKNKKVKELFTDQRRRVEQGEKEKQEKSRCKSYYEKLCGQMFRKWEKTAYNWENAG